MAWHKFRPEAGPKPQKSLEDNFTRRLNTEASQWLASWGSPRLVVILFDEDGLIMTNIRALEIGASGDGEYRPDSKNLSTRLIRNIPS